MKAETCFLGIEFGSTRIKAAGLDGRYLPVQAGGYSWKSSFTDGIWTYSMEEVLTGLKAALEPFRGAAPKAVGISGMMHGYLAFDEDWNLLVPFRTWQNTITGPASEELTKLFRFNIPQRWSIAHLYQAILNKEEHVSRLAHITTLAGYVHFLLTGVNAVGIGEASGIFPIDSKRLCYDEEMVKLFDTRAAEKGFNKPLLSVLPAVLPAGAEAGSLTEEGAAIIDGILPAGTKFAPCEGDAGTGMTATNAVAPRTGNISAGTSIFSMTVLEKPLKQVYSEIDMVTTPTGAPVAMVHCNNCTNEMNAWIGMLRETAELFGASFSEGDLYTKLYQKSLEGDQDAGGVTVVNYLAGEGVSHFDEGRPLVLRSAESSFNLANFMRAQLYASMATLHIGHKILQAEGVSTDEFVGHGGLFKTPGVAQNYMAAACLCPVTCMESAGEGGPYGMALLAAFACDGNGRTLEQFLNEEIFSACRRVTVRPDPKTVKGFAAYAERFEKALVPERAAVENC